MLVRLFGENYGPFKDAFELSMEALHLPAEGERGTFELPIEGQEKPLRLLRLAAIYGPNASGKSTIIKAARALRFLAIRSGPRTQKDEPIGHYAPFLLDRETRKAPCVLGCEVWIDRRIVRYEVRFDRHAIVAERITDVTDQDDRVLMDRGPDGVLVPDERVERALTVDLNAVVRPNAAALSVAAQLNQAVALPLFGAIDHALRALDASAPQHTTMGYTLGQMKEDNRFMRWAFDQLLRVADLGVTEVRVEEREIPDKLREDLASADPDGLRDGRYDKMKLLEPVFRHRGVDSEYELDSQLESAGTMKMLALAGPWYDVIHNGYTVFADELSASLHPELLVALLEAFNAPPGRPPSQLVLTLHDPTPLDGTLRRDQVFFVEKDPAGAATIYPLSDFGEREEHNHRKRYLQGRYGAIPRALDFRSLFEDGAD